ncbi:MAG: hypothetical protein KatS3mg022_2247 [Armatimonadota bacterium]|nr:MAG: hypothetical protein KatS3mg022_2247 [Armatimonadota bacterium]
MMKTLIYCPRNWGDDAQAVGGAAQTVPSSRAESWDLVHAVEAEDFATLQRLCLREGYQHVIVPGTMYTPPEVILWLKRHRIRIHDAMRLQVQQG